MRLVLLGLVLLAGCRHAAPPPSVLATSPEWTRTSATGLDLRGRDVVFVAGFMNELIPGYFDDAADVAREAGASVSIVRPRSRQTVEQDTFTVGEELTLHRSPVVLVGHSKGGADVLLTVLQRPELVLSGRVAAVVVVQGCVGGSPLADAATQFKPLAKGGLKAITTTESFAVFDRALADLDAKLSPEQQAELFRRIFYVRSSHRDTQVAAELALSHELLASGGPNDGLVPLDRMRLGRGVDLGVFDSDHASLVVAGPLSTSTREERRTLSQALFREVGRQLAW